MQRVLKALIVAVAAFGLAAGASSALAQKAETPKKAEAMKKAEPPKKAEAAKADAPKGDLMDINTASEKELASLKGIGDVRAKAIVKGRGKAGYKGKDDLVRKKIIPQSVYDDIKEQIIAKQK